MREVVRQRLELLKNDFAENMGNGKTFDFFFCPILYKDENTKTIQAHIINQSFPNVSTAWTIQRGDVDHFYGTHFESGFTKLQYEGTDVLDVFADSSLYQKLKPELLYQNQAIQLYPTETQVHESHSPFRMEGIDNLMFGVKMSPDEFKEKLGDDWAIAYELDITLDSFVSLIKAAHLTLFHLIGYRYTRTSSSLFIGYNIVGEFFRQNYKEKNRQFIRNNAIKFFEEFKQLVRPVESLGWISDGTVLDNIVLLCRNISKNVWGMIVLLNVGGVRPLHAVLLPMIHDEDSTLTFHLFLKGRLKRLEVARCRFEGDKWNTDINWYQIHWVDA